MPPNNLCCKQMFDSFLECIFDRRWRSISYKVIKVFIEIVSYVACELQWQIKYFGIFLTFESKWEPSNPQLVTWIIYLDVWWDTFLSVHYILYSSHFQRLKRNWTFDWKLSGQAFFFLVISQQIEQIKDLELISSVDLSFCTPEKPNKPVRDSRDFRSGQINRVLKKKEFIVRKTPGDI